MGREKREAQELGMLIKLSERHDANNAHVVELDFLINDIKVLLFVNKFSFILLFHLNAITCCVDYTHDDDDANGATVKDESCPSVFIFSIPMRK